MARTPSNMLALGTVAPNFTLPDTISGNMVSLNHFTGKQATVIMFICNHCPFVKHVNQQLVILSNDYLKKNVAFIAISSNDVNNYPEDSPELMKKTAMEEGYPFPYLYDETQEVAKAYDAACTPDFYIFNKQMELVYRGQLDNSRPGNNIPVTGEDIRSALEAIINSTKISKIQKPSIGCNIKWKI